MYEFIRIQYAVGRLTDFDVLGMVPKYLTSEQASNIINGKNADK